MTRPRLLPLIVLFVALAGLLFAAKPYKRLHFNYGKLKVHPKAECDTSLSGSLDEVLGLVQMNQSSRALEKIQGLRNAKASCAGIEGCYSVALYHNGRPIEAAQVIDQALKKFGPHPFLLRIRARQCIESADMGIAAVATDGMVKYLPKKDVLPYDEKSYVAENLRCAAEDLAYLVESESHADNPMGAFQLALGNIYAQQGDFKRSDMAYERALDDPEYEREATRALLGNAIQRGDTARAFSMLEEAISKSPHRADLHMTKAKLLKKAGKEEASKVEEELAMFYQLSPSYIQLLPTREHMDIVFGFADGNRNTEDKLQLMEQLEFLPQEDRVGVLISILHMHENHGNGIESKAVERLGAEGSQAVPALLALLAQPSSTCAITNGGMALADIKDERGWEALVGLLPAIDQMAATMIPPEIPSCLVSFDSLRAIDILLPALLNRLKTFEDEDDGADPLGSLGVMFGNGSYYIALARYPQEFLSAKAREHGFSEQQITELLERHQSINTDSDEEENSEDEK